MLAKKTRKIVSLALVLIMVISMFPILAMADDGTATPAHDSIDCAGEFLAGDAVAVTCTADGYTPYACALCDAGYQSDVVAATGHSHADSDEGKETAPTETEQGFTTYTCVVCSASYDADFVEATGNSDSEPLEGLIAGQKLEILFPDENFQAWIVANVLKNKYSSDEGLSEANITAIKTHKNMSLQDKGIKSIEGIGYFEALTSLNVSSKATKTNGNKIDTLQTIPIELYSLKNMTNLTLNYNNLREIPAGLSAMRSLITIGFAYNELTVFPEEIGSMTQLQNINFSSNRISSIPDNLSGLKKVGSFTISSNLIEVLPASLWDMTSLTNLALANNKIKSIAGVEKLTKLTLFTIAYNQVTDISGLNMEGMKTPSVRQAAGHLTTGKGVTVKTGATSAEIDINDYAFLYNSIDSNGNLTQDPFVRVYLNVTTTYSTAYRNYESQGGYWSYEYMVSPGGLKDYAPGSTVIDRSGEDTKVTIEFDADATYYILRLGNHDHVTEKDGDKEWTSFWNFDVSYVIPIIREEDPIINPITYSLTVNHIGVDEDGNRTPLTPAVTTYHSFNERYTTSAREFTGWSFYEMDAGSAEASGYMTGSRTVTYLYAPDEDIAPPSDPLAPGPGESEDPTVEIPDPSDPLSDTPQTGDGNSVLLMVAIMVACGFGLLVINLPRKKENEN